MVFLFYVLGMLLISSSFYKVTRPAGIRALNCRRRIQQYLAENDCEPLTRHDWKILEKMYSVLHRYYEATLCNEAKGVRNQLSPEEVASFDTALRLYYTNAEVNETNFARLSALNRPVKKIEAQRKGRDAHKAAEDEADNLAPSLHLCIGARVMLTTNLWTENGLVNGAMGIFRGIPARIPLPVRCDDYKGLAFPGCGGPGIIPVFSITRQFEYKSASCSRTQFPLRLAYS
jgi:DNA helicase Pif1-like protein